MLLALFISSHISHLLQGSKFTPSLTEGQLAAFARILATVVLPVPLGPQNKYAWATLPMVMALVKV